MTPNLRLINILTLCDSRSHSVRLSMDWHFLEQWQLHSLNNQLLGGFLFIYWFSRGPGPLHLLSKNFYHKHRKISVVEMDDHIRHIRKWVHRFILWRIVKFSMSDTQEFSVRNSNNDTGNFQFRAPTYVRTIPAGILYSSQNLDVDLSFPSDLRVSTQNSKRHHGSPLLRDIGLIVFKVGLIIQL